MFIIDIALITVVHNSELSFISTCGGTSLMPLCAAMGPE
jgi:hypothetical protein